MVYNKLPNSFHCMFLKLYEKHIPTMKMIRYSNRKPWSTEGIKPSIKTKNILPTLNESKIVL